MIDIWSAGCIVAELLIVSLSSQNGYHVLFRGQSDIDQVIQISHVLGTPCPDNWADIAEMPDYGKIIFKDYEKVDIVDYILSKTDHNPYHFDA